MTRLAAFQAYYASGAMRLGPARALAAWNRYRRMAAEVDTLGANLLVLDVGCGPGPVARILAPRHRVVGVDIAGGPLEEFSRFGLAVRADALALPFADGAFDVILCGQTLYHLPLEEAVAELARVVRPGGHVLIEQGMLTDASLWPQVAYWGLRKRLPGRFRLLYESGRPPWRRLRRALEANELEIVRRIGLEISTGPLFRSRIDKRLKLVSDELPKLASQQLIVARRR